ncbi:MAG: O-antigen ligase domain-containing protein [Comamonadaceae bacterium]|nr:MAG: O-antigen ligase domain-containing protein [Comamonadaceae bacterium]
MLKEFSYRDSIFWIVLSCATYIAVLPMSQTIALRSLSMLIALVVLTWQFFKMRSFPQLPVPVFIWAFYLLLFPLFSQNPTVAWESLGKQWGMGLLAMVCGAGAAQLLVPYRIGSALQLGFLSCITILIHLCILAVQSLETSTIAQGWGRETHHADLGYASGQAVILLAASLVACKKSPKFTLIFLILACLTSTALARSRAGLAFSVFGLILVFGVAYWSQRETQKKQIFLLFGCLLIVSLLIFVIAAKTDSRWRHMESGMTSGLLGNALQVQCLGTESVEHQIIDKYGAGAESERIIASVNNGDGSRVILFRSGVELVSKNPWGIDGSRQAYKKLLRKECPEPVIDMAHAHNGWIDTALAIGWIGAGLYLFVLINFSKIGFKNIRNSDDELNVWGVVLFSLAVFWIVRAFFDSVFRDHMFEMQGFVLAYAFTMLLQSKNVSQLNSTKSAS